MKNLPVVLLLTAVSSASAQTLVSPEVHADGLIGLNQTLVDWLKSKGVKLTWVPTPGTHSFTVWRRYLAELVPLLFQGKP